MVRVKLIKLAISITLMVLLVFLTLFQKISSCKQIEKDWPIKCGKYIKPFSNLYKDLEFLIEDWNYLLGFDRPTTYLILLQNDTEMRANGGFIGSYAVLVLDRGKIDMRFQDIYVPDGQLGTGHVEAPIPIEKAFRKGGYYLRDSDWDPDFTISSKTIRWFFNKGGEVDADVMMTISLATIKKIMQITGPISIPDYKMELNEDNIFNLLQAKVETDFFPGSTQKKDILTNLGSQLMAKLEYLSLHKKFEILQILWQEALNQNILINTKNSNLQKKLELKNLSGTLEYPKCLDGGDSCLRDVFMAVEVNLGANKANCCTERNTTHEIFDAGETLRHDIKIVYTNKSIAENPILPDFFGGNYIDYVRFYLPKNCINLIVEAEPTLPTTLVDIPEPYTTDKDKLDLSDYYLFKIVGLFHITRALTSSSIHISYELPKTDNNYELHILKQHGMQRSPQEIRFEGKLINTQLENDFVFSGVK